MRFRSCVYVAAIGVAGCTMNPDNGGSFRPLEQPAASATAAVPAPDMAACLWRQLDAKYSPGLHRTRPAAGDDEIIYLGSAGVRNWEFTVSPTGPRTSVVTFRSMGTIFGHDHYWKELAPQRAACGI